MFSLWLAIEPLTSSTAFRSILSILGRLQEHAGGLAKSGAGLVTRRDLNSLVDACKLLGVEARALGLAEAMRTPCSEGQEKATDKKGAIYDRI